MQTRWTERYAQRTGSMRGSIVRELLKLTDEYLPEPSKVTETGRGNDWTSAFLSSIHRHPSGTCKTHRDRPAACDSEEFRKARE